MHISARRRASAIVVALLALVVASPSVVTAEVAAAQGAGESFTIAVLPDTQHYVDSASLTANFNAQTDWIVTNRDAEDIVFVTHVGDVVQTTSVDVEWERADDALDRLDAAGIPWGVAPGNHDLIPLINPAPFDFWFGADRFAGKSWYVDGYPPGTNRHSAQVITVAGQPLLFVHLRHVNPAIVDDAEQGDVFDWLSATLDAHPNHLAFVTTHEFTQPDGSVGFPVLEAVLAESCQVAMVFSGHRFGSAAGSFTDDCGRTVQHVLTNYQSEAGGGGGFLRLVTIDAATLDADLRVYSPVSDSEKTGPTELLSLTLDPAAFAESIGDIDCDTDVDLLDARVTARAAISVLTDSGTCEAAVYGESAPFALGDVDGSATTTLLDAREIAQCAIGMSNDFCS